MQSVHHLTGLEVPPTNLHSPTAVLGGSWKQKEERKGNITFSFERDVMLSGLFELEIARPRLLLPFLDAEVEGETNYPVAGHTP